VRALALALSLRGAQRRGNPSLHLRRASALISVPCHCEERGARRGNPSLNPRHASALISVPCRCEERGARRGNPARNLRRKARLLICHALIARQIFIGMKSAMGADITRMDCYVVKLLAMTGK
jgi:hypothetical protein